MQDWFRARPILRGKPQRASPVVGVEFDHVRTGADSAPHSRGHSIDSIAGIRDPWHNSAAESVLLPDLVAP